MIPLTRTMFFVVLALVAASMSASAAEDKALADEKLIEQLGSNDFAQRERAARMLQARGPASLPALRKAKTHRDAEVRRRVLALIPILETAALLEPKRVTLGREPQTLSAIFQEIEKQTGYRIGRDDKEDERDFRVEMKGVPFWAAVERIGRETGRVVSVAADEKELRLNPHEARSPFVALRGPFRLELSSIHEARDIDFTQSGKGKEPGRRSHRLTLTISVLAEPRFHFLAPAPIEVRIATDEDGKPLERVEGYTYDFQPNKNFSLASHTLLQRTSEQARKIKVLRGTIPVYMAAKCNHRAVITNNVLKAKGIKCRIGEGGLEITKVMRRDDGDLQIDIAVPPVPKGGRWRWSDRIHLKDDLGYSYKASLCGTTSAGGQLKEISLLYTAANDPKVGPPSKLVVEDWTTLHYAIPFEFKDVPLP